MGRTVGTYTRGGLAVFFGLATVTGIVFLIVGGVNKVTIRTFDSAKDFTDISCTIVHVTHTAKQISGNSAYKLYCVDIYSYKFTVSSVKGDFSSAPEETDRNYWTSCESSTQRPAKYGKGENISCWKPTQAALVDQEFASFYKCENDPCYKVLSPFDTHAKQTLYNLIYMLTGAILFGIGASVFAGGLVIARSEGVNPIGVNLCRSSNDSSKPSTQRTPAEIMPKIN